MSDTVQGASAGRRGRTGVAVLAALLSLASTLGCGSDDGADAPVGGATVPDRAATADGDAPPGTRPEEVAPHIAELLAGHDRVVAGVVADLSIAADPDAPLVREFLGLFEPDSVVAAQSVERWATMAADGVTIRPASDRLPVNRSRLDGPVETVSADEVRFRTCDVQSSEVYDAAGRLTQRSLYREVPGEGVAVRVDGRWVFRELELLGVGLW